MSCSYPLHVHETQAELATLGWLFLCSQILMASACRETGYAEDERCGQPPTSWQCGRTLTFEIFRSL